MDDNTDSERRKKRRQEAWNRATYAYGTAWFFRNRMNTLQWKLRATQFLGVVVPVSVGAVAVSFGAFPELIEYTILTAGALGLVQLILTVWGLAFRWEESYADALNSVQVNTNLRLRWEDLGRNPPDNFDSEFETLKILDREQEIRDSQKGVRDQDHRIMMRAALLFYSRPCATCGNIPENMKPTPCPTCGNF